MPHSPIWSFGGSSSGLVFFPFGLIFEIKEVGKTRDKNIDSSKIIFLYFSAFVTDYTVECVIIM